MLFSVLSFSTVDRYVNIYSFVRKETFNVTLEFKLSYGDLFSWRTQSKIEEQVL